ncbi:MAG TPA: DUF5602 domain-containing protein [Tepidisphaeraceae bacterium]|jgi:hypothetical protein
MFGRNGRGIREFWIDAFCVAGLSAITLMIAQPRESSRINAAEVTPVAKPQQLYGEPVKLGNGTARTKITLDEQGRPSSIGIVLDQQALEGLPDCDAKTPPRSCCEGPEYVLSLPKQLAVPPYDHVVINWNPRGHEPVGVYDVPHFDFHFYMINQEERHTITGKPEDKARECRQPGAEFCPVGYINTDKSYRHMGNHLVDADTPELHGQPFTRTFIYGTLDGRISFIEPMITRAYLLSHPSASQPIKQPQKFGVSGYYPTHYSVKYDGLEKVYLVTLDNLIWR